MLAKASAMRGGACGLAYMRAAAEIYLVTTSFTPRLSAGPLGNFPT
jgi:hypothetical protein